MSLRRFLLVQLLLASFLLWGCDRTTKHRLLAFFFDGVPDLEEGSRKQKQTQKASPEEKTQIVQPSPNFKKAQEPQTYFHPPYAERMCDSCHDGQFSQRLVAEGKELCFTCHDNFLEGAKVRHFPAEEGQCLECHNPHSSQFPKLLKQKGQALCFTCHDKENLATIVPHDSIEDADCLDCHDPHRGEEKLLK